MRRLVVTGLAALVCAGAGQALAAAPVPEDPEPPPAAFKLPGATLRIAPTQVSEGARAEITFSVALTRKTAKSTFELTLPALWRKRAPDGGARAVTPLNGSTATGRVRARRAARVVRFTFTKGRRGDTGRYTVTDRALPAGTYRASFRLREADGYQAASGLASIVVLGAPTEVAVP